MKMMISSFDQMFSQVGESSHPHACIIFDDLSCYRRIASRYIIEGLNKNEKCIMAVDTYRQDMIEEDFAAAGENLQSHLTEERLLVIDVRKSYSGNGGFEPDNTVRIWQEASRKAVDQGFKALRVVGEATFSLGSPDLADKLVYYENIINQVLFPHYPFKSLCVYDKRLYPPEIIKAAISAHPILFYNDELYLENIHYIPPDIHFRENKAMDEVDAWLANVRRNNRNIRSLRRTAHNLEIIFNSTPNILMLADQDARIDNINRTGIRFGRKPRSDLCGLLCGEALRCVNASAGLGCGHTPLCDQCPVRTRILSTFETGLSHYEEEGRMVFVSDGREVTRIFMISTHLLEFDDTTRVLVSMTDITDHKLLEERLLQAQKMESIGNLAGGIAHDFNNLLFPIIGMAEMLLEDLPKDGPEHENLQEILRAGKRGSDLVRQILAFSRQDAYEKIPIQVQKVVKEAIKLSRSAIPADIDIRESLQPDCGRVMADPTRLHQIVMNLVTNAYHAVESVPNGVIRGAVKESVMDARPVGGDIPLQIPCVLVSVSDNGVGIAPEHLGKIFEPYFTTKVRDKGTGLGLSVVYGIVNDHQGDIRVASEPGRGTTVTVFLPMVGEAGDPGGKTDELFLPSGTERILVVDDEPAIAGLIRQMLERLGYTAVAYTGSPDALEAFRSDIRAFDLVISDMTMPGMTGDRLAGELMALRPDIPVILCTGFSERMSRDIAGTIGVKGLLMKPIVKAEMAKMVRSILDGPSSETP